MRRRGAASSGAGCDASVGIACRSCACFLLMKAAAVGPAGCWPGEQPPRVSAVSGDRYGSVAVGATNGGADLDRCRRPDSVGCLAPGARERIAHTAAVAETES